MTQFIIIFLTLCQPSRIRLASAPRSRRCCAVLLNFVPSLIVRMMPPWLVAHPRVVSVRLIPDILNRFYYE